MGGSFFPFFNKHITLSQHYVLKNTFISCGSWKPSATVIVHQVSTSVWVCFWALYHLSLCANIPPTNAPCFYRTGERCSSLTVETPLVLCLFRLTCLLLAGFVFWLCWACTAAGLSLLRASGGCPSLRRPAASLVAERRHEAQGLQ